MEACLRASQEPSKALKGLKRPLSILKGSQRQAAAGGSVWLSCLVPGARASSGTPRSTLQAARAVELEALRDLIELHACGMKVSWPAGLCLASAKRAVAGAAPNHMVPPN